MRKITFALITFFSLSSFAKPAKITGTWIRSEFSCLYGFETPIAILPQAFLEQKTFLENGTFYFSTHQMKLANQRTSFESFGSYKFEGRSLSLNTTSTCIDQWKSESHSGPELEAVIFFSEDGNSYQQDAIETCEAHDRKIIVRYVRSDALGKTSSIRN